MAPVCEQSQRGVSGMRVDVMVVSYNGDREIVVIVIIIVDIDDILEKSLYCMCIDMYTAPIKEEIVFVL